MTRRYLILMDFPSISRQHWLDHPRLVHFMGWVLRSTEWPLDISMPYGRVDQKLPTPHDVHLYIEPSDRTSVLLSFNEILCVIASH